LAEVDGVDRKRYRPVSVKKAIAKIYNSRVKSFVRDPVKLNKDSDQV